MEKCRSDEGSVLRQTISFQQAIQRAWFCNRLRRQAQRWAGQMAQIFQRRRHLESRKRRSRGIAILPLNFQGRQVGENVNTLIEAVNDQAGTAISSLGWRANLINRSAGNNYQIASADVVDALGADLETLAVLNVDAATNRIGGLDHFSIDIQIVCPGLADAARSRQG